MSKHIRGTLFAIASGLVMTSACAEDVDSVTPSGDEAAAQTMLDALESLNAEQVRAQTTPADASRPRPVADEPGAATLAPATQAAAGFWICTPFTFNTAPPTVVRSCVFSTNPWIGMVASSNGPLTNTFDLTALALIDRDTTTNTTTASWPAINAIPLGWGSFSPPSLVYTPVHGHCYGASAALHDRRQQPPAGWFFPTLSPMRCY